MIALPLVLAFIVGITERCLPEGGMRGGYDYAESVRKAGDIPVLICRTAKPEDADEIVSKIDMLLLTGGEDVSPALYGENPSPKLGYVNEVRDAFEEGLLRAAVRQEKPIFGTCRGHQHVNVFFGGTLHQDLPSELGERYTILHSLPGKDVMLKQTNRTHRIEIAEGSRLARACGRREAWVNSLHHQAVKGVAPGMTVTARAEDGVVEAIECGWYPAAGVQFHPECLNAYAADPVWERFYRNLKDYVGAAPKVALPDRPIGVFDSGIGGLSVLEQLLVLDAFDNATGEEKPDGKPDFADEDFVYFGDQANMPYERYDAAGKADFLRELVIRDAQFVLGSEGHDPSKIVVIACNTATAYGLERVKAMPRPHDADVIGVDSAVYAAVQCYRSLRKNGLLKPAGAKRPAGTPRVRVFVSVGKNGELSDAVKYGRDCGMSDIGTKIVPLAEAGMSKDVLKSVSRTFPTVGRELGL